MDKVVIENNKECTKINNNGGKEVKVRCKSLNIMGTKYRTLYTKKFENRRKWVKSDSKIIKAFIPGVITNIFIKDGMKVKKGDEVLILDAMKMNNRILFPKGGIIKKVKVKQNQCVVKGQVLVEMS